MTAQALKSTQNSRIQALKNKHAALSRRVKEAQNSPGIMDTMIMQMKKEKLRLKEQIEGIRA